MKFEKEYYECIKCGDDIAFIPSDGFVFEDCPNCGQENGIHFYMPPQLSEEEKLAQKTRDLEFKSTFSNISIDASTPKKLLLLKKLNSKLAVLNVLQIRQALDSNGFYHIENINQYELREYVYKLEEIGLEFVVENV